MSGHARARGDDVQAQSRPTDEALRRMLEGRVERLEAGLRRYRELDDVLMERDWESALRERLELLREVLDGDAACLEAVERVRKRAEVEHWPGDIWVLELAREVTARRLRLEARARERLRSVSRVRRAPALEESLRRLEALVRVRVSLVREPGESFTLQVGSLGGWKQGLVGAGYFMAMFALQPVVLSVLAAGPPTPLVWAVGATPVLLTAGAFWLFKRLRPGVLWLTPRRLVWAPSRGEPVELRLDSIAEEGIHPELDGRGLRVEGGRLMDLRGLHAQATLQLRLWLELLRQPELRERTALMERPLEVACFPARLRRDKQWESGQAVLTRRMLYFLPGDSGAALARAATGRTPDFPIEPGWVLEVLRWQPESDVDGYLLRAVKASRGVAWPSDLARLAPDVPLEQEIHITYGAEVLVGRAHPSLLPDVERILAAWPRPAPVSPRGRGA